MFWGIRLFKVIHDGFKAWEIRHFFHHVLHITDVSCYCNTLNNCLIFDLVITAHTLKSYADFMTWLHIIIRSEVDLLSQSLEDIQEVVIDFL